MPRIITVQKARKEQGKCGHCGKEILAGDAYRHTTLKTGQRSSLRKVRCMDAKCSFRPSELTTARRGEVYAIVEGLEDELGGWTPESGLDDLKGMFDGAADEIEAVAEQYREAAENIRQGFDHDTYQSEELDSTADEVSNFAEEVRNALDALEDMPEKDDADRDEETQDEGESDADFQTRVDELVETQYAEALESWGDEVRSEAESAIGGCPV